MSFTAANWNVPQTVTVTGVDDDIDGPDRTATILTAAAVSGDAPYSGLDAADVAVTVTDDDTAGIVIAPPGVTVAEAGGTESFTVVLTS